MLKNKNGFQVNISLSIFFIAFCDLFTDFPSYIQLIDTPFDTYIIEKYSVNEDKFNIGQ
jgi:hypothetical protein